MKYILVILLFAACKKEPEYHPIIYTSEWACEQERLAKINYIAKLSSAIDTLIARRDRMDPHTDQWKVYNLAILQLATSIKDPELSKHMLDYLALRMGFDPKKIRKEDVHYGQ